MKLTSKQHQQSVEIIRLLESTPTHATAKAKPITKKEPISKQMHNYLVVYRLHGKEDKILRYKGNLQSLVEEFDHDMDDSYIISIIRVAPTLL